MNEVTRAVRVTYDEDSDAAYIYFSDDIAMGGVVETVPMDPLAVRGMINLDFDIEGRLIGIEVLAASKRLPRQFLKRGNGDA